MNTDTVSSGSVENFVVVADVLPSSTVASCYAPMKAPLLLKQNIDALLRKKGLARKDLAQWCYKSESWISKIYREERRQFPIELLDRIADCFGLATYQLFQPGIASTTERRSLIDRRGGKERRQGYAQRVMLDLQTEIEPFRGKRADAEPPSPLAAAVRRLTEDYERKVSALLAQADAGGQAAAHRRRLPQASQSGRSARGSDSAKG